MTDRCTIGAMTGRGVSLSRRAGWRALVAATFLARAAYAEPQYVTDELVVGVYAQPDLGGDRLVLIRTGDEVEVLGTEGDATNVRLPDGTEGWVKTSYLDDQPPRATRLQALEAENKQLKNAARPSSDAGALQKTITDLRSQLEASQKEADRLRNLPPPAKEPPADEAPVETLKPRKNDALRLTLALIAVTITGVGGGFAWGYLTLDRRIRRKYGGLKVY
jgi:hypothetical protein